MDEYFDETISASFLSDMNSDTDVSNAKFSLPYPLKMDTDTLGYFFILKYGSDIYSDIYSSNNIH